MMPRLGEDVSTTALDVAILGGGFAGNLLARQLVRRHPELRIGLFEKDTERSYKVGESTVELGSHYFIRRLGLQRYLYDEHLPKNGLRYFFDDPERSTPVDGMSEIGSWNLPFHPAFQIDRARIEEDLFQMNLRAGVDARCGTRVERLELGEAGAPHRFETEGRGERERFEARWIVDATGRQGLVARSKGLRTREEGHQVAGVWARFENVRDVDELGDDAYRKRVRHTCRSLSTLHFCYRGYWIWVIPLRGGLTSVGVVGDPARNDKHLRTLAGFQEFLRGHRALAQLLEDAKPVDVGAFARLAFGTERFVDGADRFALVGDAASFTDPLYSPGTDFIALENDFVCDLIAREHEGGEDPKDRAALYDEFLQFRHDAALCLYRDQYPVIGSAELMRLKWDFDLGCYYNLWVAPYMQGQYLDERWLRRELRQKRFVLQALANFAELFTHVGRELEARGQYHRANRGEFTYGLEHIDFVEEVGLPRTRRQGLEATGRIFNSVRKRALALLGQEVGELPLTAFMVPRPLWEAPTE